MKGWRAIALGVLVCLGTQAHADPRSSQPRRPMARISSPDGAHAARVDARGQLLLDGERIRCGAGRVVGRPQWRHDGQALAFLVRSGLATRLVVLPQLDPRHPLVWRLPATAAGLRVLSWISPQRVGLGHRPLLPRLTVSWSTPAANLNLW